MALNVLDSEENKKQYTNKFFTEDGLNTIANYVKSLAKEYIKKKPEEYPFRLGLVFGIPMFEYANVYNNQAELLRHIKSLAQLLALDKVEVDVGESGKAIIELECVKNGN
jgi:hypothetical protein